MTVRGFAVQGGIWLLLTGLATISTASSTLTELTSRALTSLRSGQPVVATTLLEEATAKYPQSAHSWILLGSAYSQLGRASDAIEAYRHALRLEPDSPNALFNIGILHLRQSNYPEAVASLERFCNTHPNDASALVAYSNALLLSDRKAQASSAVKRASEVADTPEVALQAAQVLLQAGHPDESSQFLKAAIEKWPSCKECTAWMARAEYQLGHHSTVVELLRGNERAQQAGDALMFASSLGEIGRDHEAIDVLEATIRSSHDEKSLYLLLSQAYFATGQQQAAGRVLQSAKQRWPNDSQIQAVASDLASANGPAADTVKRLSGTPIAKLDRLERSRLLQAHLELKQFEQAVQLSHALLSLNEVPESTVIGMANLLQMQQRDDEAVALLEQWRPRFGDSSTYLFTLGLSQFNLGRYTVSQGLLKAAVEKRPDLHQAYFVSGHCLASQGLQKEALTYYKKASELAPERALYQFHVGLLLQQLETPQAAEPYLKRAVDMEASFPAARYQLAKAYFDSDRAELALDQLLATVQLDPSNESAYYLLGRVHSRLGHVSEAKESMARLRGIQAGSHQQRRQVKAAYAGGKVTP